LEKGNTIADTSQQERLTVKYRVALTLAAAGLYILSMDPFGLWPLIWVALAPLFMALCGAGIRTGFRLGMLFGVAVFGVLLHWFVLVFGFFGALLPLVPAVFMGLFALMFVAVQKRFPRLSVILTSVVWVGLEFFRSELWYLRFSWLTPGYCQHSAPVMIQSADLLGCYWLTFLVISFNSFVAGLFDRPARVSKKLLLTGMVAIAFFVPVYGFLSLPVKYGTVKPVALAQTESGYEKCLALSRQYLESGGKARLFVWPEYSTRCDLTQKSSVREEIADFCRQNKVELVLGAIEDAGAAGFYNTAFYINESGEIAGKYAKGYPVQFFNDGIPGRSRDPVDGNLGVLICYDLGYPEVARNLVRNGATVLLVPTMDAHSWGYWMHAQHAAVAPLRAVETQRWVIRAASSGISMVVFPHGEVRESLDYGEEGLLTGAYMENPYLTPYVRFGYLFPWVCFVTTLVLSGTLVALYLRGRNVTSQTDSTPDKGLS
jgi:apolipoprotein N-acyltransferase